MKRVIVQRSILCQHRYSLRTRNSFNRFLGMDTDVPVTLLFIVFFLRTPPARRRTLPLLRLIPSLDLTFTAVVAAPTKSEVNTESGSTRYCTKYYKTLQRL